MAYIFLLHAPFSLYTPWTMLLLLDCRLVPWWGGKTFPFLLLRLRWKECINLKASKIQHHQNSRPSKLSDVHPIYPSPPFTVSVWLCFSFVFNKQVRIKYWDEKFESLAVSDGLSENVIYGQTFSINITSCKFHTHEKVTILDY